MENGADLHGQGAERQTLTLEERNALLGKYIADAALRGYLVVYRDETTASAVLSVPGKPVNDILWLLLTLFSCGCFGVVWIILKAMEPKEQRIRVSYDQWGNLVREAAQVYL